jgi:hypothetical protein
LPTDDRRRLEFGHERRVIDAVKTLRDIDLEYILGSKLDAVKDRCDRIPTGTSWTKAIEVG